MAKFKQVPQTFLFNKLLEFWINMVRNYNEEVQDDDFFTVLRNCFDHDKAVELIETAYTARELEQIQKARNRRYRLDLEDPLDCVFQCLWNNDRTRGKCKAVLEGIHDYMIATNTSSGKKTEPLEERFREIRQLLRLTDLESEILMIAYVKSQTCFGWPCRIEDREKPLFYAMALDRSYAEVSKAMNAKGALRKFDLLDSDWDFNGRTLGGYIDGTYADALERRFYKKCEDADILPWNFYGDLATGDGETIKDIVRAAKGKCNILLYGAPGTGKTSFAKSLAKELGLTAFEVKQGDEDGRNMRSEARMTGIQICNDQEDAAKSIMIVDEADELLRGSSCGFSIFGLEMGGGKSTEKGVMNSILDEMKIPAIWISNAPARVMDESVRRRFDYSVCFERMNAVQRASVWRNLVKKHGLGRVIPEAKIDEYSTKYQTSAGGISTVLANVKRMVPGPDSVDELVAKLMKPHCRLMGIRENGGFLPARDYSLEGLNIKGKVELGKIVRSVRNYLDADFNASSEDRPRMNILLHGAPGTGKTEFVKYLGKELGRRVLVMKGSDILSKWVGGTEENIADAFSRAEAEHAILFFDEVDGLLRSRETAGQGWEVSQVNELLQQMEDFNGVMIAATNFSKNLDPATMRRFTFKLEFDYLTDEGRRIFFERTFGTRLTEEEFEELKTLKNLAPGDFRTVRQENFYLADEQTNADRIEALREECRVKKDGDRTAPIGFGACA